MSIGNQQGWIEGFEKGEQVFGVIADASRLGHEHR
jgi:hypothetical protein